MRSYCRHSENTAAERELRDQALKGTRVTLKARVKATEALIESGYFHTNSPAVGGRPGRPAAPITWNRVLGVYNLAFLLKYSNTVVGRFIKRGETLPAGVNAIGGRDPSIRALVQTLRKFHRVCLRDCYVRRQAEKYDVSFAYALEWNLLADKKEKVNPIAFTHAEAELRRLRALGRTPLAISDTDTKSRGEMMWVPHELDLVPVISKGGWDSTGEQGLSPWDVSMAWRVSGCRNTTKFRWLVGTLYLLAGTGLKSHLLRLVRRNHTSEKTVHLCRGLCWLVKAKQEQAEEARISVVRVLGRLRGFSRAAALYGVKLSEATCSTLNWEMVSKVRTMGREEKARLFLLPVSAFKFLYQLDVSELGHLGLPHPAGLKLGVLHKLLDAEVAAATAKRRSAEFTPASRGTWQNWDVLTVRSKLLPEKLVCLGTDLPCLNLALLFGSVGAVDQYNKRAAPAGSPRLSYHDLGQFRLPETGLWDRAGWSRLALKHGEEVVSYGAQFHLIEAVLGRVPRNLRELREQGALIQYENVAPADQRLAQLCSEYKQTQEDFEAYQTLMSQVKDAESLPYVKVEGREVGVEGDWKMEKLAFDDPLGPLLGEATNCCQHLGGAGSSCAAHGVTSPYGGFYAVWYQGRVVAQSWAWRGTRGELVFDNIEFLAGSYIEASLALYEEASRRLLGKLGVSRVLVGLGYGDSYDGRWAQVDGPDQTADPVEPCSYTDAINQALIVAGSEDGVEEIPQVHTPLLGAWEHIEGPFDGDVVCEHCDEPVHPAAEICNHCGRDISDWVD